MSDENYTPSNTPAPKAPYETLKDGNLTVNLWKENGQHGAFLKSGGVNRTYTDQEGNVKHTRSLAGSENLRGANLLTQAHNRITAFKQQMSKRGPSPERER